MIKKSMQTALRITFLLAISQAVNAQTEKAVVVKAPAPKLDYEYQFLTPDSSEGIEKSFKNGKLFAEIHFKNKGEFQFIKRYDPKTGNLFQTDTVMNFTKQVGSSVTYFPTGAIKEVQHRDTAGNVDHYTGYFENGQKKVSIGYRKGKRNGSFTEYHPGGQVKETGKYLNDKREGVFKFYDARGTLLLTKRFKQDVVQK
jgi:antitoxin component YwqK of YwqJK toxin-antitoxin module